MNIDTNPHAFPMANYFGDNPPAQGFDGLGVCHEMTAHLFAPSSNDPVISSVVRIMTGREADFGPFFLAAHAISQGLEHCRLAVRIECRNGRRQVMSDDLVAFVRDGEWDVVAVEE